MLGGTCAREAASAKPGAAFAAQLAWSLVVIALTAGGLVLLAAGAAHAWGRGWGIAVVVSAWIVMQALRLGYEYDDGIDFKRLLLPSPFDWGVKIDRLMHFWGSPGIVFRAMYLGTLAALIAHVIIERTNT